MGRIRSFKTQLESLEEDERILLGCTLQDRL
jgi:hypothetical protein